MTQKNETLPLVVSLLVTIALLGGGGWWLANRFNLLGADSPNSTGVVASGDRASFESRLSLGGKVLAPDGANDNPDAKAKKQAGVEAIAAKNYAQAVADLEASLQAKANDPEALIYLNNARIGEQKAYTIAIAVPLATDVDASLEMLRGVAQAQDEVNKAGGISGVPLKVAIVDDGGTVEGAQQVAAGLVGDSSILGVVGHYTSDASIAAGKVYDQGKLVMISPVSTSVQLSNASPFVFRTVPSDFAAARALANYMTGQLQQQKAAVFFNSQSGYSQSLKSEFVSALGLSGGQVVSEIDLSSASFSAAANLQQVTQQGATVLVLLPNSGQLDRALQVLQVNQGQLKVLTGDDAYAPKTLSVGQKAAEGLVVAVPWHILANPQAPFVQSSRQLWKADVNWRTAMSYDATAALVAALGTTPTRQGVQEALRSAGFSTEGAGGSVQFLPSGDRNQSVQLVQVQPGSRSGYGFDFVPLR
ncbi:amino acid ABC transporter substrate-binding protein [Phormidium tenue FACHB-886]|nr:amino acid ABC transporter substrate-binding protein [Phormidium tenue FACHB-886]